MNHGNPFRGGGSGSVIGGLTGPVPRDLWVLLGVLFFTFSLQFFSATASLPALLRLTPAVWLRGFLWQMLTFPFIGIGLPNFWFLLELLILFLFGRDVLLRLGRRQFWRLLVFSTVVAAGVAVVIGVIVGLIAGAAALQNAFLLMQGQRFVLTVLIAAFATLNRHATILLFFVLPIRARWFLLLEIVFAFLGFLGTHDLPGFAGLCVAVGFTFGALTGWRRQEWAWQLRLRLRQLWLKLRLAWLRRRRGLHVVRDDEKSDKGPWLH